MSKERDTKPFPVLHPWGSPVEPEKPDAICSHCKNPFVGIDGYVSEDFSLCGVCNDR